jgi:hypothetical protein
MVPEHAHEGCTSRDCQKTFHVERVQMGAGNAVTRASVLDPEPCILEHNVALLDISTIPQISNTRSTACQGQLCVLHTFTCGSAKGSARSASASQASKDYVLHTTCARVKSAIDTSLAQQHVVTNASPAAPDPPAPAAATAKMQHKQRSTGGTSCDLHQLESAQVLLGRPLLHGVVLLRQDQAHEADWLPKQPPLTTESRAVAIYICGQQTGMSSALI